jgi:hypothetical protein
MRQRRAWLTVLRTNSNADFDFEVEIFFWQPAFSRNKLARKVL